MAEQTKVAEFVPTGSGNEYLDCGEYGISFNPSPGMGLSMFAGDSDGGETAIVANGDFFILNGDFREEYAALVDQGLAACLRFFADRPELVSSWSDSVEDALALALARGAQ